MRGSLLSKIVSKLIPVLLLSVIVVLLFGSSKVIGVLALVVDFMYVIYLIRSSVIKPLNDLVTALEPINFSNDTIDFTKLDNFNYTGSDEIGKLVCKFKDLSEVLVARVDRVNTETYKSEHDGLSGLYNRVKYQRSKDVYAGCSNICVIYIDVNNLKKMNDIFGHDAGDSLIKKAASKLDFWDSIGDCYRMGGDEFMVVIPNRPKKECEELINQWYPTVGCLNRKSDGFKCMMAYGVSYGGLYSDIDDLIKEADEKMYNHKIQIKEANGEDPNSR